MINGRSFLNSRVGIIALGTIVSILVWVVVRTLHTQPERIGLFLIAPPLMFLGIIDRAFAAISVLAIIFFGPIFEIPVSLGKIVGAGITTFHLGVDILKRRRISLDNNLFLFGYASIIVLSGVVNDLGVFNYGNKVILFNLATYLMIRYLLRNIEDIKRFLRLYCYLILSVSVVVFIQGREGARLLSEDPTLSLFGSSANMFAFLLALTMPSCYYFLIFTKRHHWRGFFWGVSVFLFALLIWSASRSGMLGFFAGVSIICFYARPKVLKRLIAPTLIVVIAVSILLLPGEVWEYSLARYLNLTPGTIASTDSRIALTRGALEAIPRNLVIGVGGIGEGMRDYLFPYTGYYKSAHSTPLTVLLQYGIPGFVLFYLALFYAFWYCRRSEAFFSEKLDEKAKWIAIITISTLASYTVISIFLDGADFKPLYIFLGIAQVLKGIFENGKREIPFDIRSVQTYRMGSDGRLIERP